MVLFKCKMCGGTLEINNKGTVAVCQYCGTKQTVAKSRDEVVSNLFNRANNLRLKCEFDKAEQVYEKILDIDNTDPEAHWGVVLCKYGIEYVEDSKTYSRIPTCHRTLYEPVLTDVNYLSAIENADEEQRELYIAEAKMIDGLQKNILNIVNSEEPFDVFICYKETDENGKRTIDSAITNDIYYQLTQEGFKVFYAPITLEDKLGHEYEPYIFAALNSAKVMLVVGTKPEYFDSVWVRNEWSRFFKTMKNDRSKLLIPCYRDMDVYELPDEFAHLQAQDMSKIGFISDVIRGLKKVFNREEQSQPPIGESKVKKPSKIKLFFEKSKQKRKYCLAFPETNVFNCFYFIALFLNIYFFCEVLFRTTAAYDDYLPAQILILLVPTLIVTKKAVNKVWSIIVHSISALLCLELLLHYSSPYNIGAGLCALTLFILLLSLLLLIFIFFTRKTEKQNVPKIQKGKVMIPAIIFSTIIILSSVIGGMKFCDYQFAKMFYSFGAYEYAAEYFSYLGDYRDSEDLSKNSILYRAIELLDDDEKTAFSLLHEISSYIESNDFAKELVYNSASSFIEKNNTDTAISLLSGIQNYKDSHEKIQDLSYNKAKERYASKQYGDALEILSYLGDFRDSKALVTSIQTESKNTALQKISTSKYIKCSVEELYRNPYKYNGKKVMITSWKVSSEYHSQKYGSAFYDFLLCDDLTHFEEYLAGFISTYIYYEEYIEPYRTPYIGVQAFADVIYKNISDEKSKMLVYGTFTYHPNTTEGGYIRDPHVYNLDVDYYVEY